MNDSDKQVDEISDSEHLVVTRSNPKSNPNSDSKTATDTTNENFTHKLLISRFVPNIIPVFTGPINPLVNANVVFWTISCILNGL